jgi:hypothetical protein
MRRSGTFHWGVPLVRGKGVYNKGSSAKQQIFARKVWLFPELGGNGAKTTQMARRKAGAGLLEGL